MSGPFITRVRPAGDEHRVVTVEGGAAAYRRSPCGGCPWRLDQTGQFPAEAFLHSAETAYDMASHKFACHEAGAETPLTCAGFLLRGAEHNMAVRMAAARGGLDLGAIHDGGHHLHRGYWSMAVSNGCDPHDPRLAPVRLSSHEEERLAEVRRSGTGEGEGRR